jgi:hypothetical protein
MLLELIKRNSAKRGEVLHISALLPLLILLCVCAGLIAGCGGITIPSTGGGGSGVALSGMVHGGPVHHLG